MPYMTDATNDQTSPRASDKQLGYMRRLARDLGFDDASTALASMGAPMPLTVDQASAAINLLKAKTEQLPEESNPAKKSRYLTARMLRKIDEGAAEGSDPLDEDAAWVLKRLAKLRQLETVMGSPPVWNGVNAGGPILIEHLVAYFHSIERVASEFGVSVATVKGWGTQLPANRTYEAQVRTQGHVSVPTGTR